MSESRYIFLSYRSTEADFALKLAADLKNAGVNLWMDRLDISPGDDWRKSLEGAVYSCAALIAILSPSYVSSKYCQRELARADRLGRPIFPVLLGSIGESDWPLEIERQQYIDFSNWRDTDTYQQQIDRLVDILKEKFAAQISVIPNPETQYLTNLAADMETQRGLIEYLEFSTEADKWLTRE
ncbi:MAG: toll/interleukin-1 receptor domain-containing protein, partial [Anaerolineae bacterium]|nr:toll/interleukin-1 receptor domain-containing protein [Anaerolineae bacterium]